MFPAASVTVHVTVVLPTGNESGASLVSEATVQLSVEVGDPNATPVASHAPASTFTVTSEGQVIEGAIAS